MLAAVDVSGLVGYVVGGVALIFSTGLSVYFAQRNRDVDKSESRTSTDAASRVADSKNALDAWISISAANTSQIASLTTRLDAMQRRVDEYEQTIVPGLEKTIADQKTHIDDLLSQIDTLTQRIDKLEKELEVP